MIKRLKNCIKTLRILFFCNFFSLNNGVRILTKYMEENHMTPNISLILMQNLKPCYEAKNKLPLHIELSKEKSVKRNERKNNTEIEK